MAKERVSDAAVDMDTAHELSLSSDLDETHYESRVSAWNSMPSVSDHASDMLACSTLEMLADPDGTQLFCASAAILASHIMCTNPL